MVWEQAARGRERLDDALSSSEIQQVGTSALARSEARGDLLCREKHVVLLSQQLHCVHWSGFSWGEL